MVPTGKKLCGEPGYLAEGGPNLRVGMPNAVGLVYGGSLLAACLSAIIVVAGQKT